MSDSVIPWTVAHQGPLFMGFPRQEYWSGLPFPYPGESFWPRDWTQVSCTAGRLFTTESPGVLIPHNTQPGGNGHPHCPHGETKAQRGTELLKLMMLIEFVTSLLLFLFVLLFLHSLWEFFYFWKTCPRSVLYPFCLESAISQRGPVPFGDKWEQGITM